MINSWSDTLIDFLRSSNEDEKVFEMFTRHVLPHISEAFKCQTINWLEVGAGDGNKTKLVAKAIRNLQQVKALNMTICEPSIDWLVYLQGSAFSKELPAGIQLSYINKSFEEFVNDGDGGEYNFISLVQVMYKESIKNALLKYIDKKEKCVPSLIWVDVEDKSGDFYKMRKLLSKEGKVMVRSLAEELIHELKNKGIPHKTFLTTNKVCVIDKNEIKTNDNHWIYPFILGCSKTTYNSLDDDEKKIVRGVVRKYIKDLKREKLEIPDISVLIHV